MRALLVDDDLLPMKELASLIEEHCQEINKVEMCSSPIKAIQLLRSNQWDILFLDIEMPEMTGFELLDALTENQTPNVVFLTAHNQYAIEAFRVNAIDYLLKPIALSELLRAVSRVDGKREQKISETNSFSSKLMPLFDGDDYRFFQTDKIIRVLGEGSYCKVFSKDEKPFLVSQYLGKLEASLLKRGFVRCHRSHMINQSHIAKYSRKDGGFFVMSNGDMVPVSVSRKQHLKELFDL